MLAKGGFAVKCRQFSQESGTRTGSELKAKNEKVTIPSGSFHTHMGMLKGTGDKRKGVYTGPNLEKADMRQALPLVLTRRIV